MSCGRWELPRAFVPEAAVTDDIATDLLPQNVDLLELHIDRAYLTSTMVKQRQGDESDYL